MSWTGQTIPTASRSARPTIALFAFGLVLASLSGCGWAEPEQCPRTFVGGGEFTITFSGGIEGTVSGKGLTEQQLARYLDTTQYALLWDGPYRRTGMTGALCHNDRTSREPCSAEFAAWLEVPEGALTNTTEGTLVGVAAHQRGMQLVIAPEEIIEGGGPVEVVDVQLGPTGSAEGKLPAESGRDEVVVEVEWALDESVHQEVSGFCPPQ